MPEELTIDGARGKVVVSKWPNDDARYLAVIAHGYGEHIGRYEHVAQALVDEGAVVYGPDHLGHGRSEGDPALVPDMEEVVADLHKVVKLAQGENPGLNMVLIGHSMGGIIATRYAQEHGEEVAALVLSGPAIGGNPGFEGLLAMDPIPEIPIDPAMLSRDPSVGEAYAVDPLVYHGPFKRETLQALFGSVATIAAGPTFTMPTLWIHGEEDPLAPLDVTRPVAERLGSQTRFESKIYPGAKHEVFNETNRDEVIGDVVRFIDFVV
ncbi:MAG TPA: alpha/beta hydrolase [Solirubrobacteraceae bacterium]|jgi:alpha-beta hydrolase superfamily lysophospholipase|nr:alpha/beta hydrolase [Solirubrobacteraceae bacterium]